MHRYFTVNIKRLDPICTDVAGSFKLVFQIACLGYVLSFHISFISLLLDLVVPFIKSQLYKLYTCMKLHSNYMEPLDFLCYCRLFYN